MQYKCDFCQDTGSLNPSADLLDCVHCDTTTDRIALNKWLAEQYKQGTVGAVYEMDAWRIHQRALAMAPKQEAPAQEPVAAAISYWTGPTNENGMPVEGGFANMGKWSEFEPTTLKHGNAIKERGDPDKRVKFLFDVNLVQPIAVPSGKWVAKVHVTHKGYGMELAKYIAYSLPEGTHELFAAPAAANGAPGYAEKASPIAITDSSALNGIKWYVPPPEHLRNGMQLYFVAPQPVAAAGPDAALVKALESARLLLANTDGISKNNIDNLAGEEVIKIDAALSGAKGN